MELTHGRQRRRDVLRDREIVGRKPIVLFNWATARNFADVHVLAQMMDALNRFTESDLPVERDQIAPLRQFSTIGERNSSPSHNTVQLE